MFDGFRSIAIVAFFGLVLQPAHAIGFKGDEAVATMTVPSDGIMRVRIDGVEVLARVGPGMPNTPYLSHHEVEKVFGPGSAAIDPIRSGKPLFAIHPYTNVNVGPRTIRGSMRSAQLEVGGQRSKVTTRWFEADAFSGNALMGPWALPAPVVKFNLAPASAGEAKSVLPLSGRLSWWVASTVLEIGGKKVRFAFAPQFPRTIASAAAGSLLVREFGGGFVGPPARTRLQHGVDRPIRPVRLARPLRLGSVALEDVLVRTADYGRAGGIPDDAVDPSEAPDEIVVTGRKSSSKVSYLVYIGADVLSGCSSIMFDKKAKTITLACRE